MKARTLIGLAAALIALYILIPSASGQTLEEIFETVLQQAVTTPLPGVIWPLIDAARDANTAAVARLEITVAQRECAIKDIYLRAETREEQAGLERQEKACLEIKSELARIKNQRTARKQKIREAKEGGQLCPFHGRFYVSPRPDDWNNTIYETHLLIDGFGDIPGDDPPGPVFNVVTRVFGGRYKAHFVPALEGTLRVWSDEASWWSTYPNFTLYMENFGFKMDSFEIAPGVSTGANYAVLNPFGSPPVGQYSFATARFEIRLEGMFTNNLYNRSAPILFFASFFGCVPPVGWGGGGGGDCPEFFAEAAVGADNPMIVPLIGRAAEPGLPKVMGAHVMEFDYDTHTITLLENTTLQPYPDVAMARYEDGSYTINPEAEPAIGARVLVERLSLIDESPPGVFNFEDTTIRIEKGSAGEENLVTLLTGVLRKPVVDEKAGGFFAELEITEVSDSSLVLSQINNSKGIKVMQIAAGAAVYDLIELTQRFNTDTGYIPVGTGVYIRLDIPGPELFHLGVVRGCDPDLALADIDMSGTVNLRDFAGLALYWLQNESFVDIVQPDGNNMIDARDLSFLAEYWLGQCR